MILADPKVTTALNRLRLDIQATGLSQYLAFVQDAVENLVDNDYDQPSDFVQQVVDVVQQRFQDEFIDTTWPACPRHQNHPLDYGDGIWHCPRDRTAVAQLGELKG